MEEVLLIDRGDRGKRLTFMLKGAISRTCCVLGPVDLGPLVRAMADGSKSGG